MPSLLVISPQDRSLLARALASHIHAHEEHRCADFTRALEILVRLAPTKPEAAPVPVCA